MSDKNTMLRHVRSALRHLDNARKELRLARRAELYPTELEACIIAVNNADVLTMNLEDRAVQSPTDRKGRR